MVQKLGPLIYEQALRSCLAFLSPLQYSSHRLNILACCFLYFLRCNRFSFSQTPAWCEGMSAGLLNEADQSGDTEEAEICWRRDGEVRDASPLRRCSFVWTVWKTVQVDGSQVLPSIQVDRTYWMNCLRFPSSVTCDSKRSNCGTISSSGRDGNAITRRMKSWVPRSSL